MRDRARQALNLFVKRLIHASLRRAVRAEAGRSGSETGRILALLGLGCLLGGMVFFGAIVAPAVFIRLPAAVAGPFIRGLFPLYYGYVGAMAALAAMGLWLARRRRDALVALGLVAVTLALWGWWLPQLEVWRLAGNMAAFNRGHRISVDVNGVQMLVVLWLLMRAPV